MISHLRRLMRQQTSKTTPRKKKFNRPRILEVALKLKRLPKKAASADGSNKKAKSSPVDSKQVVKRETKSVKMEPGFTCHLMGPFLSF